MKKKIQNDKKNLSKMKILKIFFINHFFFSLLLLLSSCCSNNVWVECVCMCVTCVIPCVEDDEEDDGGKKNCLWVHLKWMNRINEHKVLLPHIYKQTKWLWYCWCGDDDDYYDDDDENDDCVIRQRKWLAKTDMNCHRKHYYIW